jgi:rSAM/selenodomain-associated transferase 1
MKNALIIMTKVPVAGNVKTRLEPFLTAEQCAELSTCFLLDAVSKIESLRIPLVTAYTPVKSRNVLLEILPAKQTLIEQIGEHLGEKMFNAFQFAFTQNLNAVVMIGTDSPTLPIEFIARAFEILSKFDAVLGKTTDGGFYLIGLRVLQKQIFDNVEWSSPETFEQTARNIEKLGLKLALLPDWYDVDTPKDLKMLMEDLAKNPDVAPNTFNFINNLFKS